MITEAYYGGGERVVIIVTEDRGHVFVNTPEDQAALDAWLADGGEIDAQADHGPVPVVGAVTGGADK